METPRLRWHVEPAAGWINDPNGLIYFQNRYHAFFQHYPHAPHWGPMHWGHAVSEDLLHWELLPIALAPDQPYEDLYGCFSGSAVEREGRLWVIYTAVSKALGQTQCVAWSDDGVHFEKFSGNPVIPRSPVDPENKDFRDPKVIPYEDGYLLVVGAGVAGQASVELFRSPDLLTWEYVGPLFQTRDMGPVCECPDFFPLGDRWVLCFSRMDDRRVQFVTGSFDGARFTPETFSQPEQGPDFYAAQSFPAPDGRRLCLGWMYSWERQVPEDAHRAGALTLPRQLTLDARGRVRMAPVAEAAPLLRWEDPCLTRSGGKFRVSDGKTTLLELPQEQVQSVQVLADGPAREVFLNGGETVCTFYLENS